MPSLANEIDNRPALLPTLQVLQRKFRKLTTAQTTAEQNRQNGSVALSCKSLGIGHLPQRRCLTRRKPVAQTRAQFANTFNAMDAGGQVRGQ